MHMYNLKHVVAIPTLLFLFAVGCGIDTPFTKDKDKKKNDSNVQKIRFGTPVEYGLYNEGCQLTSSSNQVTRERLYTLNPGAGLVEGSDADTQVESNRIYGLNAGQIMGTVTNVNQLLRLELVAEQREFNGHLRYRLDEDPYTIKVCEQDATVIPSNTLESVALTSIVTLVRAEQFYSSLSSAMSLKEYVFNVFPNTKTSVYLRLEEDNIAGIEPEEDQPREVEIEGSVTDNASWSLSSGDESHSFQISVYPQSQQALEEGLFHGAGLWQIPFVLSHEFGHHIFYHHYKKSFEQQSMLALYDPKKLGGLFWTPQTLVTTRQLLLNSENPDNPVENTSTHLLETIGAVNESFADLFAHYALNEDSGLATISGFAKNREVNSSQFSDGKPKRFDRDNLNTFLAGLSDSVDLVPLLEASEGSAEDYDLADIHIAGAIIAHGVDQLLTVTSSTPQEKATKIIEWINALNCDFSLKVSAEDYLGRVVAYAAHVSRNKDTDTLDDEHKRVLREVFPVFIGDGDLPKADLKSQCK